MQDVTDIKTTLRDDDFQFAFHDDVVGWLT